MSHKEVLSTMFFPATCRRKAGILLNDKAGSIYIPIMLAAPVYQEEDRKPLVHILNKHAARWSPVGKKYFLAVFTRQTNSQPTCTHNDSGTSHACRWGTNKKTLNGAGKFQTLSGRFLGSSQPGRKAQAQKQGKGHKYSMILDLGDFWLQQ